MNSTKIIISILIISLVSNTLSTATFTNNNVPLIAKQNNEITAESHIILDVPYIGQDTRFYCTHACHTMMLNYYGFNFTKYEELYLMGGGFSMLYRPERFGIPYTGYGCSARPSNYEAIGEFLGLAFDPFFINLTLSEDIIWDTLWNSIKQNISQDRPIMVWVDEIILYLDAQNISISQEFWTFFPISAEHAVTIVGYNESNNTICIHDPVYSIFDDENKGTYLWIDIPSFELSFHKFTKSFPYFPSTYRVKSYKKPENVSYSKEEIIEKVFQRNIKRLQGHHQYYASDTDFPDSFEQTKDQAYGINATKELKKIFGKDLQTQIETIIQYKINNKLGIKNQLLTTIEKIFIQYYQKDISFALELTIPGYRNIFKNIAEEKNTVSQVLNNFSHYSEIYEQCSILLKQESENWSKLAEYNKILMDAGIFITIPKALQILNEMDHIMDKIISIEEEIIALNET